MLLFAITNFIRPTWDNELDNFKQSTLHCSHMPFFTTTFLFTSPYRILRDFFRFLQPKMTAFAVTFLKICGDICSISYCFAVKIYHGQHSSNIVITFLTSRTILGLQTNIWGHQHQCHEVLQKLAPEPDSKVLALNRTCTSQRCLFDVWIYICMTYFLGCLLICNISLRCFLWDVK